MRTLDPDLTVAQKLAPLIDYASGAGTPAVTVTMSNKRGGVTLASWTSLYNPLAIKSGDRCTPPTTVGLGIGGGTRIGMQIAPKRARGLTSISLKLYRRGSPGTLTLAVKALDVYGKPTGADLKTATYNGDTLTTATAGEWVTFSFTNLARSADTQYCWILRAPTGDGGANAVCVHFNNTIASYQGASLATSNAESTWAVVPGTVYIFIGSNTGPIDQSTIEVRASAISDTGVLYRIAKWASSDHLHFSTVNTPTEDSVFTDWQDLAVHCTQAAIACEDENIVIVYVDPTDAYDIWEYPASGYGEGWGEPVDLGFASDIDGYIAITNKDSSEYGMVWTLAHGVYGARRVDDVWDSELDSGESLQTITGITVTYERDFNIVVTGIDADDQDGVWQITWGDGYNKVIDEWSSFAEIVIREASEDFEYGAPSLGFPDVYRLFFVEHHTGTVAGYREYWSYMGPEGIFIFNLWLEPVPFNSALPLGLSACNNGLDFFLSDPNTVLWADLTPVEVTVTDDLLEVNMKIKPGLSRSSLIFVLDNLSGQYNDFYQKGWEVTINLGYETYSGPMYSELPNFWVTGWEFCSPPWFPLRAFYPQGVVGTLKIYCEGAWELLDRWRARRKISWAAGEAAICKIMEWIVCRAGLQMELESGSHELLFYKPEFDIPAGNTGKWALKKLLGWVEDVPTLKHNMF